MYQVGTEYARYSRKRVMDCDLCDWPEKTRATLLAGPAHMMQMMQMMGGGGGMDDDFDFAHTMPTAASTLRHAN